MYTLETSLYKLYTQAVMLMFVKEKASLDVNSGGSGYYFPSFIFLVLVGGLESEFTLYIIFHFVATPNYFHCSKFSFLLYFDDFHIKNERNSFFIHAGI